MSVGAVTTYTPSKAKDAVLAVSRLTSAPNSNLDILRSLAVLAVLTTHTLQMASGTHYVNKTAYGVDTIALGLAGVLTFFVHTSLVLMQSLERTLINPDRRNWAGWAASFYARRAFRIYPLSICLIIISIVLAIPPNAVGDAYRPFRFGRTLANLLLVQNLTGHNNVADPLWSLPYEVQMYVALPLLFLVLLKDKKHLRLILIYVAGGFISRGSGVLQFLPCFLAGAVAYRMLKSVEPRMPAWLWTLTVIAIMVIFVAVPHSNSSRRNWVVLCLSIGMAIPLFQQASGFLASVAQTIATYSYGIYLCHTPMLWLVYRKLALPGVAALPLFVLGTGLASWACFHFIEKPVINFGKRLGQGVILVTPDTPKSVNVA